MRYREGLMSDSTGTITNDMVMTARVSAPKKTHSAFAAANLDELPPNFVENASSMGSLAPVHVIALRQMRQLLNPLSFSPVN